MSLIRIIDGAQDDPFGPLHARQIDRDEKIEKIVAKIIEDVRSQGDTALLDSARTFDAPNLAAIKVTEQELNQATIPPDHLDAIRLSIDRVRKFHSIQLAVLMPSWQEKDGFYWRASSDLGQLQEGPSGQSFEGQRISPVQSAGVYVPGGKANYPSSVIMNAVPAQVAGVERVAIVTPARQDATLSPAVLVAAREIGVTEIYKIGGAAAIAALSLGTQTINRVDKIVGPGNKFVNEAKRQLWGRVGLDGYAGPSEVCVFVDETSNPVLAAADLLTQVEHSEDNAGFIVSTDSKMLEKVLEQAEIQLSGSKNEHVMREALASEGIAFIARDTRQACEIIDAIAPEHLSMMVQSAEELLPMIHNAGCILLGDFSAQSAGDFCAGPSHTLPTSGAARFQSPVNVLDFLKVQSISRLSRDDLAHLLPAIEAFGEMEGFPTHSAGAAIRFNS